MKSHNRFSKKLVPISIALSALVASGCGLVNGTGKSVSAFSSALTSGASGGSGGSGGGSGGDSGGGQGSGVSSYSSSVPTADAIVGRIQKGLPSVSPVAGNFKTVLAQVQTNLPTSADPTKASGLDQIPLLVYAACADVNPTMYGVTVGSSLSSQTNAIIAAGVTMVNAHVGNLAAAGTSLYPQVQQVFQQLVQNDANAAASTANTFISVCMAANTFGVGMLGF